MNTYENTHILCNVHVCDDKVWSSEQTETKVLPFNKYCKMQVKKQTNTKSMRTYSEGERATLYVSTTF